MRVYVPLTLPGLARLRDERRLGPAPISARAVTPMLREWYLAGDEEELEAAAMADAARGSLVLLAGDAFAPRRRVVVAADVADRDAVPLPAVGRAAVEVRADIPLASVAAVHVDDAVAQADIAAAAASVAAAVAGDEDARLTVDGAEDHDLLWYATQELDELLAEE